MATDVTLYPCAQQRPRQGPSEVRSSPGHDGWVVSIGPPVDAVDTADDGGRRVLVQLLALWLGKELLMSLQIPPFIRRG